MLFIPSIKKRSIIEIKNTINNALYHRAYDAIYLYLIYEGKKRLLFRRSSDLSIFRFILHAPFASFCSYKERMNDTYLKSFKTEKWIMIVFIIVLFWSPSKYSQIQSSRCEGQFDKRNRSKILWMTELSFCLSTLRNMLERLVEKNH